MVEVAEVGERVETFQNPVRTLGSRVIIDDFAMRTSPQEYSEFAIKQLARQFAECIAPYMDIQHSFDSRTRISRLDARIKIVEPINKPTDALSVLRRTYKEGESE